MSFPVVHPLFSIPLYESRIHFDKQYIIEYLEKDLQWVTETFINNNRNDISVDQRILDTEFFKDIRKQVDEKVAEFAYDVLRINREKFSLVHVCSWVNSYDPEMSAPMHHHGNAVFSGVLYFQNADSLIEFEYPSCIPTWKTTTLDIETDESTILNSNAFTLKPEDGTIIIFPSHLDHTAFENPSKIKKYSLAFNYFLNYTEDNPSSAINMKVS